MDKITTASGHGGMTEIKLAQETDQLNRAKALGKTRTTDEASIDKAAGGFEALLLHQMLQAMWATVGATELTGEDSYQGRMYRDMLNQAIADSVAEGKGIGVKDFLKKELTRQTKSAS